MLLTVIIVTKNPGNDVYPTLSSLKSLDESNVEILIKDNSSNRDLESVNDIFKFKNLRYIYSDDTGVYDAMNQALEEAKGEFIYFLNAGDLYLNCGLLEELKNDDGKTGFYYGHIINLRPFVRLVRYSNFINKYSIYLRRICHQSIVFKMDTFKNLGSFDTNLKVEADYLFSLKLLKHYKGKSLNQFIAIYKGGGLSYHYKQTKSEKEYLRKKIREIFSAPEIWFLSIVSVIVTFLVFLKNINKTK